VGCVSACGDEPPESIDEMGYLTYECHLVRILAVVGGEKEVAISYRSSGEYDGFGFVNR
jgi:hypothetical protein